MTTTPAPVDRVEPPQPPPSIRGAREDLLARPAALFLASIPWDGKSADPDTLTAAAFFSRL